MNRLAEAAPVSVAIICKLEQKLSVVTAMPQVVDLARNDIPISPWHEPIRYNK